MALNISFFDPGVADLEERYRGAPELPRDLFGFYSWRSVWGSSEILDRGGKYLSVLKSDDLYVFPNELSVFKEELTTIYSQSKEISVTLGVDHADMKFRLENAISACDEAIKKGYGVCID